MRSIWSGDKGIRYIVLIAGTAAIGFLLYYLRGVLAPFCFALLLAYILDPLVTEMESVFKRLFARKGAMPSGKASRVSAVITVLAIIAGVCVLVVTLCVPVVVEQSHRFAVLIEKFISDSSWTLRFRKLIPPDLMNGLIAHFSEGSIDPATLQNINFWQGLSAIGSKLLPGALGVLSGTASLVVWVVSLLFIIMYMIFLMVDFPELEARMRFMFPKKAPLPGEPEPLDFLGKVNSLMKTYFRSQTLVAAIVGALYAIIFSIMGLPMGAVLGLLIGILNLVPYMQVLSMPVAALLGVMYALDTGLPFWEVFLILAAIYAGMQVLEDMFIIPKIIGTEMNLPPVAILLSISVWGALLGFLGLVLAVPFTCIVLVILRNYKELRPLFQLRNDPSASLKPSGLSGGGVAGAPKNKG